MPVPILFGARNRPTISWLFLPGLPDGMTFTRASSGTYYGSDGYVHTAANNEPRFEFDPLTLQPVGLLIEESRKNISPYGWPTTVNSGARIADSVLLGVPCKEITFAAYPYSGLYRTSIPVNSGSTYTFSCYVRYKSGDPTVRFASDAAIWGVGGTSTAGITVNSQTGAILSVQAGTASYSVTSIGGGILRITFSAVSSGTSANVAVYHATTAGVGVIDLGMLQIEAGAFPTSYIPTSGSAVTRAADSLYTTNIPWFNPSEGTLGAVGIPHYSIPAHRSYLAGFSDGTGNNVIANLIETTGRPIGGNVIAGTVSISGGTLPIVTANSVVKSAVVYKAAANKVFSGGAADTAGAFGPSGVPSGISRLDIGGGTIANRQFNGTIQGISYYNRAISNAELQRITT